MLIDKGVSQGDIVTLKLQSGEEVVAKLIDDTDKYLKVSKPLVLTTASNGGIAMVPYLFTVDPDRDVKFHKPITIIEPSADSVAKQYLQQTSGIQVIS